LALKAGGETAGHKRQQSLLQTNTDLAAVLIGAERIQDIVSHRALCSGWVGSHHTYEAGLLSGRDEFVGDARSRLRMAVEWLNNWNRQSSEERRREEVTIDDITEACNGTFQYSRSNEMCRISPRVETSIRIIPSRTNLGKEVC